LTKHDSWPSLRADYREIAGQSENVPLTLAAIVGTKIGVSHAAYDFPFTLLPLSYFDDFLNDSFIYYRLIQ
jgi:hypothetical protein